MYPKLPCRIITTRNLTATTSSVSNTDRFVFKIRSSKKTDTAKETIKVDVHYPSLAAGFFGESRGLGSKLLHLGFEVCFPCGEMVESGLIEI